MKKAFKRKANIECVSLKKLCLQSKTSEATPTTIQQRDINIVFDLDMTMVHAVMVSNNKSEFPPKTQFIDIKINNKVCQFGVAVRPQLMQFLEASSKFANIFVRSNSTKEYTNEIIAQLINIKKEYISPTHIYAEQKCIQQQYLCQSKSLADIGLSNQNTIIIDDQVVVWSKADRDNILTSVKFAPLHCDQSLELRTNLILWLRNAEYSYKDWGVFEGLHGKSQLNFIYEFVWKCYEEYKKKPMDIRIIMKRMRKQILDGFDCLILDDSFPIKSMATIIFRVMGGKYAKDSENTFSLSKGGKYSITYIIFCFLYLTMFDINAFKYKD